MGDYMWKLLDELVMCAKKLLRTQVLTVECKNIIESLTWQGTLCASDLCLNSDQLHYPCQRLFRDYDAIRRHHIMMMSCYTIPLATHMMTSSPIHCGNFRMWNMPRLL